MANDLLERRFAAIGARVRVDEPWVGSPSIDIRGDARGQFFDISFAGFGERAELVVADADPRGRHLLLLAREGDVKSRFLCGFDERHWFVAAIPESARGVSGVLAAKRALQPEIVRQAVSRARPKHPHARRNRAFIRQGEWFFVPAPELHPPSELVLRDEPLTRGFGSPHRLEFAYRRGGELVYVNALHPTGIPEHRFRRLPADERRKGGWTRFVRDPELYARGSVKHWHHATVVLRGWHRVVMNTEQEARAMEHVAFLD